MATEKGIVIQLNPTFARVKTTRTSACEACAAKSSCRTLGGGKDMEVDAINMAGARVGDTVLLGFETVALVKLSFLIYIVPILCMITGAVVGQRIALSFAFEESLLSVICGGVFFLGAFFFIRWIGGRLAQNQDYRPKIIRILQRSS